MQIDISHLSFEEMEHLINSADFSMESDYIFRVKRYKNEENIKFLIEKTAFPMHITNKEFKKEFRIKSYKALLKEIIQRDRISFKATVNDSIAGAVISEYEPWEENVFIYELAVSKQFMRKGIGKRLIKSVEQATRLRNIPYIMLQVDCRNYPAVSFYTKRGFDIIGVVYRNIPALLMRKSLKMKGGEDNE